MLFPSTRIAEECRAFMINHEAQLRQANHLVRVIQFAIQADADTASPADCTSSDLNCLPVHIALFPPDFYKLARQFWQHTGLGISSRFSERCLAMLNELGSGPASPTPSYKGKGKAKALPPKAIKGKKSNRHYARKGSLSIEQPSNGPEVEVEGNEEGLTESHDTYLEERYGRNMSIADGEVAKRTLRRRIAGVLLRDPDDSLNSLPTDSAEQQVGSSSRGVQSLSENDVYLYPTGMGAIWSSHQLVLKTMPPQAKSVCFGFPYTDTLKILQKWGPGCVHYGNGTPEDLTEFTAFLRSSPPGTVSAFYTEFPSNPLLRSVDLKTVRKLADEHDFMVVVDDTIGNFANVEVLPYADIVVSGLTKLFSGDANVMGGR
jgi:cystathionine gamma-synthase